MKNAVLLAPYFLPRRRVGSWRPFKFAIHLRDFGWQPHVITIQDSSGKLTAKEEKLLEGIAVHELPPLVDFTSSSGSQLSAHKSSRNKSKTSQIQPVLDWVDKQFPVDTWLPFFGLKYRAIKQIIADINPEVLWSTGDPWSGHWLGRKLSARFTLPWVADFRDPWTLGEVNLKRRSTFSSAIDKRMEKKVVEDSTKLTFTSKATEQLYRRHYPDASTKMSTIYNAFDRTLYKKPDNEQIYQFDKNKLNLLFFGKFRRLSPAQPLIDLLADIKPETARYIQMHSFGPLSDEDAAYAAEKGVRSSFRELQPIPAEEMLAVLPQVDILWLSTKEDRRNIIPAKLWDYLAAGRPIISMAPNPEIAEILDKTKTGVQFSADDKNAVITLLQKCVEAKEQGEALPIDFDPDHQAVKKFEATQVTRSLAQLFDTIS